MSHNTYTRQTHDATDADAGALMPTAHTGYACTVTGLRAPGERGGREAVRLCRYSAVHRPHRIDHRSPDRGRERGVDEDVKQRRPRGPAAVPERDVRPRGGPRTPDSRYSPFPDYSGPHTYLLLI